MAIDTYALTSLANAKEYLRVSGTDNDDLITNTINRASDQIELIADRLFLTRSYSDWYDGNGERQMFLEQWPVTAVTRVSSGKLNVLGVRNTASTNTFATARVTATSLVLIHVDSSGSSTNTLTFATYTTVATLATAIDAVGSGWSSQDMGYGTMLTADMAETPALYCTTSYCYLPQPYQAITDYVWDEDSGRLEYQFGFPRGTQNIYVEYTGGYSAVPDDIEQACLMLVASIYFSTRRDPALQSERLGDYAWAAKAGSNSLMSEVQQLISKHTRVAI